jgi:hypothetical protein
LASSLYLFKKQGMEAITIGIILGIIGYKLLKPYIVR